MTKPQGGLGRGLSALIPPKIAPQPDSEAAEIIERGVEQIPVDAIETNPHQPRKHFASTDLEDLLASIKEHGILQPLVVTDEGGGKFELIAGERRLRASKMLGLKKVPAMIRTATEQQKLELALIENIQRQNLNPVEEAKAYQSLADLFSLKQEDVAKRVGKSRSYVTNTMRLLDLDEKMLDAIIEGKISRSHARTLLGEDDLEKRRSLFKQMLEGKMTVREAEAKTSSGRKSKDKDPNIAALEDQMREALGTKVKLQMKGGSGKVTISFYSKEELKELMNKFSR